MSFSIKYIILTLAILSMIMACKNSPEENIFDLACQAEERRDFTEAIRLLDKLLEINPSDLYALNNRGWDKYDLGDQQGAMADFNKMIVADSLCDKAYNSRGVLYAQQRKYKKALTDFNRVIEMKGGGPEFEDPNLNPELGRPEIPIASPGELFYWKGISNYYLKDYKEAYIDFTFCIEHNYYVSDALYSRAFIYFKAGEKKNGCEDLSQAVLRGSELAKKEYTKYCGM